jgi:hypothetical protein
MAKTGFATVTLVAALMMAAVGVRADEPVRLAAGEATSASLISARVRTRSIRLVK